MVLALILACLFAVVRVLRIPVLNQLTIVFISFSGVRHCCSFSCFTTGYLSWSAH